jgi:hypothetical protein
LTVLGGRRARPARSNVVGHRPIGGKAALGVCRGGHPLQAPLPRVGGWGRVGGALLAGPVLAVCHAGEELPLGGLVAVARGRQDHAGDVRDALEELAAHPLGGVLGPSTLPQNLEPMAVLIHPAPASMRLTEKRAHDVVERPLVVWAGTPTTELRGGGWPELPAPLADGF